MKRPRISELKKYRCTHCDNVLGRRSYLYHYNNWWLPLENRWLKIEHPVQCRTPKVDPTDIDRHEVALPQVQPIPAQPSLPPQSCDGSLPPQSCDGVYDPPSVDDANAPSDDDAPPSPIPPTTTPLNAGQLLVRVLYVWQIMYGVSATAMRALLTIVKVFLVIGGSKVFDLFQVPASGDVLAKHLQDTDTDMIEQLVACVKCMHLYSVSECYHERTGHRGAKIRTARTCWQPDRYDNSLCAGALVKQVSTRRVVPITQVPYAHIALQLQRMFARKGFFDQCQEWRSRQIPQNILADIYDGAVWQEWQYFFDESNWNLGLMMNLDWLQPYKNSQYSLGVVYLIILNLPRRVRYLRRNVIIVCTIPHSVDHVTTVPKILSPMVDQLIPLFDEGKAMVPGSVSQKDVMRCALLMVTADLPAGRVALGMLSFNATLGCSRCYKQFKETDDAQVWCSHCGDYLQRQKVIAHINKFWDDANGSWTEIKSGMDLPARPAQSPKAQLDEETKKSNEKKAQRARKNPEQDEADQKNNKGSRYGGFVLDGLNNEGNFKRTNESQRQEAQTFMDCKNASQANKQAASTGVRWSSLMRLPYFDCVRYLVIDPMHNLYMGVAKHVLKLFFREGLIDGHLEEVLRALKVPSGVGRVMSSFYGSSQVKQKKKAKLKYLKAEELLSFVRYYSDVLLEQLLVLDVSDQVNSTRKEFSKQCYKMWKQFSAACKLSSADYVKKQDIEKIRKHIFSFLQFFDELFPKDAVPNLHFALEAVPILLDYGPNHVTWCFAVERLNGILGDITVNNKQIALTVM